MALFVFRSAAATNSEWLFLKEGKAFITWSTPKTSLDTRQSIDELKKSLMAYDPNLTPRVATTRARQIHLALHEIPIGTWILHPNEKGSLINIGVVSGAYEFEDEWNIPYHHSWTVDWICANLPVSLIETDWLNALNKSESIYPINAPNAVNDVMNICKGNSDSSAILIESALRRWIPEHLITPKTTKSAMVAKKEKKSVKINHRTDVALPKAAYLLNLIECIRAQVDKNSHRHLVREIIKHIYRAQGTFIERINRQDIRLDEFSVQNNDNPDESTEKLIVHRIPMSSGFTKEAVLRCFESMQSLCANKGLLISWGERGKGPHALSEFAASYNIQLMSGDELILVLANHYDSISDRLKVNLPDKQLFLLQKASMK
jgi:predicted Mrr-cat superfamily restriction endonuclease